MTIQHALKQSSQKINRIDAELLLSFVLNISKPQLITQPEKKIPFFSLLRFRHLVHRRKNHTPLAYLTGKKEFYGLDFFVTHHTLVPRPETEIMVEQALKHITAHTLFIDVGTGTGCIPISILKNFSQPIWTFATDISTNALLVAKKNAKKHTVDISFVHTNLLDAFENFTQMIPFSDINQLVITANLPYLTQKEINSEPSIQKEPHVALYADDFGLSIYKQLQKQIKKILKNFKVNHKNNTIKLVLLMEINDHQAQHLIAFTRQEFPNGDIKVIKDLSGKRRVVEVFV